MVAVVAIAAASGWFTAPDGPKPEVFRATTILVATNKPAIGGVSLPAVSADLAVANIRAAEVPERAAEFLGHEGNPRTLLGSMTTRADNRTGWVTIVTEATNGDDAANRALAFRDALIGWDRQRVVEKLELALPATIEAANSIVAEIESLDAQAAATSDVAILRELADRRSVLEQRNLSIRAEIRAIEAHLADDSGSRFEKVLEPFPERVTDRGFAPPRSPAARAALGGSLGVMVGGALALFLHRTDTRLQNRREAQRAFRLQVLAEIPLASPADVRNHRVLTHTRPRSGVAEAYRSLRTSLLLMPLLAGQQSANGNGSGPRRALAHSSSEPEARGPGRVIVVTSPGPGEGKTSTVANLAACWAEAGSRVLVVSGDTRRPMIHNYLGVDEGPGLSDAVLEGLDASGLARLVRRTSIPGVGLLTSGTRLVNPAAILEAEHDVMRSCRRLADITIIDTPPVLLTSDALELMVRADVVVVLGRIGRTTSDAAARAAELMVGVGAPVVGVALVGASPLPEGYGRFASYYDDHPLKAPQSGSSSAPSPQGKPNAQRLTRLRSRR